MTISGPPGRSIFHNRNFLMLWSAQALSQTAQNAIWFGLLVIVEETTKSTTQMSIAVLTSILPSVFFGLVAGVLVDRSSKKAVLVVTNLLRAVFVLGFLLYPSALYLVFIINFVFCSIGQFFAPAELATIPQIVPKRQLVSANGLFNITFTVSQMAGLVILGPPVIKIFGPQTLFIALSFVYLICTVLVSLIPRAEPREQRNKEATRTGPALGNVWKEVREGWAAITSDGHTSAAVANLTLMSCLMLMMAMLAPRYAVDVLKIGADDSVFVLAPAGLGVLVGSAMMGRLTKRFGKDHLVRTGVFVFGIALMVMGLLDAIVRLIPGAIVDGFGLANLPLTASLIGMVMLLSVFLGLSYALVTIPGQTLLMERTASALRGRIFAVQLMLGNVLSVIPLVFIGGLADLFGVRVMIAFLGAATILFNVISKRWWMSARSAQLEPSSPGSA